MRQWIPRALWMLAGAALAVLVFWSVQAATAQSPVPHAVAEGDDCLGCHQTGATGAPRVAWDHQGRRNEDCLLCHELTGAPAAAIPHTLDGRDNCLSCHASGVGTTPPLSGSHLKYTNDQCQDCHRPSARAQATPTPVLQITPAAPITPVAPASESSCTSCHQLIFADDKHALFTGQPQGDAQAGAGLFAEVCASCHGADGTTPVGDDKVVINSKDYWSTHDDAAILRDIGMGSHGQMTAFAQGYGGPLSWEEVLNLVAFVRSWGPLAVPATPTPAATGDVTRGMQVYAQYCAGCHGPEGQGSPVVKTSLHTREYLSSVTDDDLRRVILDGVTGMPGFAGIISDQDISAVIALLRSWQR